MHLFTKKKCVDQDETPHDERLIRVCAICHDKHIRLLVTVDNININSYMNQDVFHFANGC